MTQQPNGTPRPTRRVVQTDAPGPVPTGIRQPGPQPGPGVVPSLDVLQAEFEELVASNQKRFAELAASGTAPDPFFLVHARLNHLIDSISSFAGPNGPRWATLTRLEFERFIDTELEQAGPVTRRMQLAEGARYTPEMISALARQTGTLRRTQ